MQFKKRFMFLVLAVKLAAFAGVAGAATMEAEVADLAGSWAGGADPAPTATLMVSPATDESLVAIGSWTVVGGPAAGRLTFGLLKTEGRYYAVPEATESTTVPDVFGVDRLPSGGLRLARLAHLVSEDQVGLREEVLTVGRPRADGTRLMRVSYGERLCFDGVAPSPRACGERQEQEVVIHKVTP